MSLFANGRWLARGGAGGKYVRSTAGVWPGAGPEPVLAIYPEYPENILNADDSFPNGHRADGEWRSTAKRLLLWEMRSLSSCPFPMHSGARILS
jgi:hypothetical protein